jgi:hypothetical protein
MTWSSIVCSNPHGTSKWFWKLPVTPFSIHISLKIRSWQHYIRICCNPKSTWIEVMTSFSIIFSNSHSTLNCSWKLTVTSFPIQIAF